MRPQIHHKILHNGNPRSTKLPCFRRWLPWRCLRRKICAHTNHNSYKFADCWCMPQHCKKWVPNFVYMSSERNWSLLHLLRRRCFLFFELHFHFIGIVSFLTTTLDKVQFESQLPLSQINVVVTIRLKFKLYAVFIEWGSWFFSCSWDERTSSTTGISPEDFQKLPQKVGTKNYLTWLMRKTFLNISSRPTG